MTLKEYGFDRNEDPGELADFIVQTLKAESVVAIGVDADGLLEAIDRCGVPVVQRSVLEDTTPTEHIRQTIDLLLLIGPLDLLDDEELSLIEAVSTTTRRILLTSSLPTANSVDLRGLTAVLKRLLALGFIPELDYELSIPAPQALLLTKRSSDSVLEDAVIATAQVLLLRRELHLQAEAMWPVQEALVRERDSNRSLHAELISLQMRLADLDATDPGLQQVQSKPFRPATRLLRSLASRLSRRQRQVARQLVGLARSRLRIRPLAEGHQARDDPATAPDSAKESVTSGITASRLAPRDVHSAQPLRVFRFPSGDPTTTVVADSLSLESLNGSARTAILVGAYLAETTQRALRVVTTREPGDPADVATLLRRTGLGLTRPMEVVFSGPTEGAAVPVTGDDIFLTTSIRTAASSTDALGYLRVIHVLHQDERLIPSSRELASRLNVLRDPRLRVLVDNTELFERVHDGPAAIPKIADRGVLLDPPCPDISFSDVTDRTQLTLAVYADPAVRLEAAEEIFSLLDQLASEGAFLPHDWRILLLGSIDDKNALSGMERSRAYGPSLEEYFAQITGVAVGIVMLDSPHTSYPMLDLTSLGADVVTIVTTGDMTGRWCEAGYGGRASIGDIKLKLESALRSAGKRPLLPSADPQTVGDAWRARLSRVLDQIL